ncbi:hemerythrin domain-containing protein [Saccharothrix sp.]|uniref:hemerythrin domain-containing protein n=1 Tax=Saccharothrix sp. TaxID=1873460 RepID=UPI002810A2E7|nr:hemerythrin domain-containing protein [Saccharothrix sp.]
MPDVVDLIMQDHREVERLFDELKNNPEKRPLLTPVLSAVLTAHSRAEEDSVYPVARDEAGEQEEIQHSQEEHVEAETLLAKLIATDPTSSEYEQVLDKLIDGVTTTSRKRSPPFCPGCAGSWRTRAASSSARPSPPAAPGTWAGFPARPPRRNWWRRR